ncbi:PREDICTED: inositol hexakisphosphate kinase 1-like isoform X2 [Priapulus caudatus]|uniref:Kinase n=1 Tax=Priapulus caudatus TaxID=37621 RepID=A0ABM1EHU0_PRICU|nr:PREDICTED: inositol hexakisphosphate kinase 1-like isoform X2 [Priapulus caudatus]
MTISIMDKVHTGCETGVSSVAVCLQPFVHQVGGHSGMMMFDETTVCKPLISRERHFYMTLPPEMKEFTPEYRGVIEVTCKEDEEGYVSLVTSSPTQKSKHGKTELERARSSVVRERKKWRELPARSRLRRSSSLENDDGAAEPSLIVQEKAGQWEEPHAPGHNPWSLKCHKEQLKKMRKNVKSKGASTQKFILLENLTCQYRYPCVLDLKMGTRQHGDDASEAKQQSQRRKCAATTSASLGVRVCGMQVYQNDSGQYICHNKYYGRGLSEEGFRKALLQFLNTGKKVRRDLICLMIERLQQLKAMLAPQSTFRFYSSSLLVMYEGYEEEETEERHPKRVAGREKVVAEACTCTRGRAGPQEETLIEWGSAREEAEKPGERACKRSERNLESQEEKVGERVRERAEDSLAGAACSSDAPTLCSDKENEVVLKDDGCCSCKVAPPSRRVDVRMIDFAHTTHEGFRDDCIVHKGPDTGYIFGLENMIRILQEL